MAVELVLDSLKGSVVALAPLQLAVLGALCFVIAAFVGRIAYRNLPSKQPPILEGWPYVGGLLKFAGVRCRKCAIARALATPAVFCAMHARYNNPGSHAA